jgi:peptidyl-dipeptidase Dcp
LSIQKQNENTYLNIQYQTQYSTIFGNKTRRLQTCFYRKYCCCKTEIDAIITNSDVPTFENTIVALDFAGEQLDRLSSIFFNLNSAETNDEMQKNRSRGFSVVD